MDLYAGTSGYSYAEWRGHFYPDGLGTKEMLSFYATQLPTVEINNTFYRLPRRTVVEEWAAAVPASFRFAVKASRRITHIKRLKDPEEPLGYLTTNLAPLGDQLGVVLFQLPPTLRLDLDRLRRFLDLLPTALPAALEFRHPSWLTPEVFDALRSHAVALCATDEFEAELPPLDTAPHAYLRLREESYSDADLARWRGRLQDAGVKRAFVYFKHEDAGAGPALARRFLATES